MRVTLDWEYEGNTVSMVRDQVIARFVLRKVERLESSKGVYMEAFELGKPADIIYNGTKSIEGKKGDYVIVDEDNMYIMSKESFDKDFKLVEGRKLKADLDVLAKESQNMKVPAEVVNDPEDNLEVK